MSMHDISNYLFVSNCDNVLKVKVMKINEKWQTSFLMSLIHVKIALFLSSMKWRAWCGAFLQGPAGSQALMKKGD